MSDQNFTYYANKFTKLRVDRAHGAIAPHKPILLLSVIELIEQGLLRHNQIPLYAELIAAFLKLWQQLGSAAHNADIGMQGIDDHERQDLSAPYRAITLTLSPQGGVFVGSEDDDEDVDDDEDGQDRNEEEAMEGDDEEEDDDDDYEEMEIDLERLRQEVGNNEDDGAFSSNNN